MNYKNKRKFFFIKKIDSHINIELFYKIRISIKLKSSFKRINSCVCGINKDDKREEKLIISLTSFPDRINIVHKTIKSLLNQTIKPDEIILWLSESQFPNKEEDLTQDLLNLLNYGLKIKWCEDLKSYKKLIPALKEFPHDIIITADDDIYYQNDWLESLYKAYLKDKKNIYTRRACALHHKKNTIYVTPHYANTNNKPCFNNQLMGGAGTLYPPNCLHDDIFNIKQIKNLIPTHDDIYFWAMAILKDTKIVCLNKGKNDILIVENSQDSGLCKINKENSEGMNPNIAFDKIFNKYPEILKKIEEK